jgi:hypothetical protein
MYARIARFEGGSPETARREAERVRRGIEEARSGASTDPTTSRLTGLIDRIVMLVDPQTGSSAAVVFCETQERLHEVDRIMDGMSPDRGEGRRVSRDIYEVVVDEPAGSASRAA